MEIKRVLVIGAGQMGNGIAQVMLQGGLEVVMQDIDQKFVDKGMANIEKNLGKNTPLAIDRGLNALWNNGGIQYAPPIR